MKLNRPVVIITESLSIDPCDCVMQTALQLSKKNIPVEIYWLSDRSFFSISKLINKKNFSVEKNITQRTIIKWIPFERFYLVKKANTYLNLLLFLAGKLRAKNIYWIFEPFDFYFIGNFLKGYKIYDCIDNFSVLSPQIKKSEKKLINIVDIVFACNQTLFKEMRKKTQKTVLVPQGFDEEIFKKQIGAVERPLRFHPSINFIFVGTICTRFDFPLLSLVIKNNPKCKFTFVGPIVKNFQPTETFDQDLKVLFNFENVEYLGVKSRDEVARLIKNSDVGLIPYDTKNLFNKYSLPLKVLEYFYFGIPVFATPNPEMKQLKDLIFIFNTDREFEEQKKKLIQNGWQKEERKKQRQFSESQSWQKKVSLILEYCEYSL